MNWMTSGRHRALYSQRGRRRQMHFPSQVQCQRVKPTSPLRSSHSARACDLTTPWYIVPVGDDNESQDIRVLELERKEAVSIMENTAQDKTGEAESATSDYTNDGGVRSSWSRTRSCGQKGQDFQDERNESRCIFTPVKKAKRYEQPLHAVQRLRGGELPPSSIASGVDMLYFDDGQELPHKTRAQHAKQTDTDMAPPETRKSSLVQQFNRNGDRDRLGGVQQLQLEQRDLDEDFNKVAFNSRGCNDKQHLFDGVHGQQTCPDDTSETEQREFQRWKASSNLYADFDPNLPSDRPESASFRNVSGLRGKVHSTPPSSPIDASPLSFRMSRAEVLQSQLSTEIHDVTRVPVEHRMSYTPILRPSPSPSTSTSSQSSIVLGRPPLGWQKNLMLSLREDTIDQPGSLASYPRETSPSSPTHVVDGNQKNHGSQRFALESPLSLRSSKESDTGNSLLNAVVPPNAKEHIMAAATSQQLSSDSRRWFQRPADMMSTASTVVNLSLWSALTLLNYIMLLELGETNGADAAFSGKSMAFQQSWVMSSRTKTIMDAVSSLKDPSVKSASEEPKTKYQEMESVAVYMYTLVQCYKIDESLCADRHNLPTAEHAQLACEASSPPAPTTLTNQAACRREMIFSPKHAD